MAECPSITSSILPHSRKYVKQILFIFWNFSIFLLEALLPFHDVCKTATTTVIPAKAGI